MDYNVFYSIKFYLKYICYVVDKYDDETEKINVETICGRLVTVWYVLFLILIMKNIEKQSLA